MPTITRQAATSRSILMTQDRVQRHESADRSLISIGDSPVVVFVDQSLVGHVEQVDGTRRDKRSDRGETEQEPHEEKDHRVNQEGKEHSKDDLHLSLRLEFLPDDVFSEFGDVVHRQMNEHGHQEEWHANEDRDGIPDEEDEGGESAWERDGFGRVQVGRYRKIREGLVRQFGGQEEVVVFRQDSLDLFDIGRRERLREQIDQAAEGKGFRLSISLRIMYSRSRVTLTSAKHPRSFQAPTSVAVRTVAPWPSWQQLPRPCISRKVSPSAISPSPVAHPCSRSPIRGVDGQFHHLQLELPRHPFHGRPGRPLLLAQKLLFIVLHSDGFAVSVPQSLVISSIEIRAFEWVFAAKLT